MTGLLESFHFLRPAWLLLLLPAGLVLWSVMRRQDPARGWRRVIAPELLEHLIVRQEVRRGRLRPALVMAVGWSLGILAAAGPAWEKEATPFAEDQSALFVVLEVTPEMLARDVQPSRLERATQKIGDLLKLRPGTRTGLVAYAGSAHLVMPLTEDPEVIRFFAAELQPDVMPRRGNDPLQALELANRRLADSGLPGSVLLVTGGLGAEHVEPLRTFRAGRGADVQVYAVAAGPDAAVPEGGPPAPALDQDATARAARAAGGALVVVTPDDADLRELARSIDRSVKRAPLAEGERWRDAGYWLMPLFALLALIFFRPGGAVALQR
jgi:Ca-activated chloride channel family protein